MKHSSSSSSSGKVSERMRPTSTLDVALAQLGVGSCVKVGDAGFIALAPEDWLRGASSARGESS
eukprot:CAMPEP_0178421300 /NCGR_PEP_ID=MMETSP0689_2-20121128/26576_1 /TAXON_ID=160604 /ORGANISM="Amphidinium massartii, Strain CS-259" /LENGTH=63 /DNA_ID=CAMNT_0020042807 /DNA_START=230 /DNA_END=421 /DNA_ORIENTATION=-